VHEHQTGQEGVEHVQCRCRRHPLHTWQSIRCSRRVDGVLLTVSVTVEIVSGDRFFVEPPAAGRFGAPLLMSVALHVVVLLVLAGISIRLVPPERPPIVVTIREPAALPPPLGEPAAAAVAPLAMPQPVVQPQPVVPKPRPKIARKPPPASAPAAVPEPATVIAGVDGGSSAAPGVAGGVLGGVVGGQVGGTVGGRGDRLWRGDEVAAQPEVVSRAMPIYPPLARARGIEGLVVIEAVIDRNGQIEPDGVKVLQSVPLLNEAALVAVLRWRFKPGRDEHGEPVRVVLQVPIRFQLR
jgi:protein TonB